MRIPSSVWIFRGIALAIAWGISLVPLFVALLSLVAVFGLSPTLGESFVVVSLSGVIACATALPVYLGIRGIHDRVERGEVPYRDQNFRQRVEDVVLSFTVGWFFWIAAATILSMAGMYAAGHYGINEDKLILLFSAVSLVAAIAAYRRVRAWLYGHRGHQRRVVFRAAE